VTAVVVPLRCNPIHHPLPPDGWLTTNGAQARQFDEMDDPYLRERKGDLEQVVERLLRHMKGEAHVMPASVKRTAPARQQDLHLDDHMDVPLVLVAHDLSPADMLQFKQSVFVGFVTDV